MAGGKKGKRPTVEKKANTRRRHAALVVVRRRGVNPANGAADQIVMSGEPTRSAGPKISPSER
jgi:hypothetical protein